MTGRYCFHRFLSVNICGGGYPVPGQGRGYPIPGLGRGWVPHPRSRWGGVPHPRSGWEGTLSQVWGYPIPGLNGGGTPSSHGGGIPRYPPSQVWMVGVPLGTPTMTGWGTPLVRFGWWGVPPMTGWGTPPMTGWGTPPLDSAA